MSCRALILLLISSVVVSGNDEPVRVAVFQGNGVGQSSKKLIAALKQEENGMFQILRISAEEICAGKLSDVDVLVHPGGSGSKQGKALGENGRASVRRFVQEGGGFRVARTR